MDKIYETHPFDHVYLMTDTNKPETAIIDALDGFINSTMKQNSGNVLLIHPIRDKERNGGFPRDMLAELKFVSSNPDSLFLQTHLSTFGMLAQGMSGVKNAWIVSYENGNNGVDCARIYTSEPANQGTGPYEEFCPDYNSYGIKDRVF